MLILAGILGRLRDRSGFTLIETLVAMITGVIVTGALFAILEVSVRQSGRLSAVAQATQISRTTMTKIVDQLRSACLSEGFSPVIEKSTANKLVFVNGYDEKPEVKPPAESKEPPAELPAGSIHKDVIEYEEATKRLIDKTYLATSNVETETAEKFPFATTPAKTVLLAENVSQVESKPIFEYFAYSTSSSTGATEAATSISKTPVTPENEEKAKSVASVVVRFRTAPTSKEFHQTATSEKGLFAEQTSQTIFAFSAPNSETTITAGPCE